ncbi:YicC/YloC family endoribonuclease [Caldalkalibacillus uzonensis]|nr:YicC/YloC family endoribonuclease [Caldalkalibacillus uzonensis]
MLIGSDVNMRSMTGYGRQEAVIGDLRLTIEVKSVNHRFCEVSVRTPKVLSQFEEAIKKCVTRHIQRGRVEVYIHLHTEQWSGRQVNVDWGLAEAYYQALCGLKERYGLAGSLSLNEMLQLPDLITMEESGDMESYKEGILARVSQAVDKLVAMREKEGEALARDLEQRNHTVLVTVEKIEAFAPQVKARYQERIEQRVKEFLDNRAEVDENRLLTEVAIFADKADISEECTRLKSHCQQFKQLLASEGPVGRKLEFLVQEMNREVNTIGSKAQAIEISQWVIELKSELEKIREQIQNIE